MLPVKNNLALPADVLAFGRDGDRIVWESTPVTGVTADAVMSASTTDSHERQDAEQFLREILSGDPVHAGDVFRAARANGIGDRTIQRAKSRLNVKSRLMGFGKDGRWYWFLSTDARSPEAATHTVGNLCRKTNHFPENARDRHGLDVGVL